MGQKDNKRIGLEAIGEADNYTFRINVDDILAYYHPRGNMVTAMHCEPEKLAKIILEETPDAIEPFNTLEEMVEYIRKAMAANYIFHAEPATNKI